MFKKNKPKLPNDIRPCSQCRKESQHFPWFMTKSKKLQSWIYVATEHTGEKEIWCYEDGFHLSILMRQKPGLTHYYPKLHTWLYLRPVIFNSWFNFHVSMCYRLTNSTLKKLCGCWIICTPRLRNWAASLTSKAVWPASQHTPCSCVWRLTMKRWWTHSCTNRALDT